MSAIAGATPLFADGINPRYFADSSGKPVYLARTYLDHDQQQKHNVTRLWAWQQTPLAAKSPSLTLLMKELGRLALRRLLRVQAGLSVLSFRNPWRTTLHEIFANQYILGESRTTDDTPGASVYYTMDQVMNGTYCAVYNLTR